MRGRGLERRVFGLTILFYSAFYCRVLLCLRNIMFAEHNKLLRGSYLELIKIPKLMPLVLLNHVFFLPLCTEQNYVSVSGIDSDK